MDSLRYWVTEMHVDGFRFDLGAMLGREPHGFDPRRRLLRRAAPGPGAGAREADRRALGHRPRRLPARPLSAGLAEWNDRFRDGIRRFWRGDRATRRLRARASPARATCSTAARARPWASVNYAASHDGFTLADLVSYIDKHNEANGEDNRDGHGDNYRPNCGVEGRADDPAVNERARACSARCSRPCLAQGTPMLLAGDELGHTQGGNNNAYCQDNAITWLDWSRPSPAGQSSPAYVTRLGELRHDKPICAAVTFFTARTTVALVSRDRLFDTQADHLERLCGESEKRLFAVRRARATTTEPFWSDLSSIRARGSRASGCPTIRFDAPLSDTPIRRNGERHHGRGIMVARVALFYRQHLKKLHHEIVR